MRWPWTRHATAREEQERSARDLAMAHARLAADEAEYATLARAAKDARKRASRALAAEQAEIRKNHLGELVHAALSTPGRHQ